MSISLSCERCDVVITADDEEALVGLVQAHAENDHDLSHPLSSQHILAHLRAQHADED